MGFSCTNSEAIMVPTFARKAMLGSNPIACAFPAEPYDFFFDASTTVVTRGKLEMYNKMEKPLPEGWRWTRTVIPPPMPPTCWRTSWRKRAAASCLWALHGAAGQPQGLRLWYAV